MWFSIKSSNLWRAHFPTVVDCFLILTDLNECTGSNACNRTHAMCTNTLGSYLCNCNSGYTGNGINCTGTSGVHRRKKKGNSLREIGGKTCTFWFDWRPAGEPAVVGVGHLHKNPSLSKSPAFSKFPALSFRNQNCLMWTYFTFDFHFVLCLLEEKRKKRIKICIALATCDELFIQAITN